MSDSAAASSSALLKVSNVTVRFGGIVALDDLSFDLEAGTICALIGPNGAGKTTLLNCLSRLYEFETGHIHFSGTRINALPRHAIAPLGIGRTFQNLALFRSMTVFENVLVGVHSLLRSGFVANAFRLPSIRKEEEAGKTRVEEALTFLGLTGVRDLRVSDLPFGTQKRVELARALAGNPKLILLDEPACGLNHEEVAALGNVIRELRDKRGITVLLIEHHMNLVMSVSDRVVVLNFGRKIAEGRPDAVVRHPDVIQAYLGAPA